MPAAQVRTYGDTESVLQGALDQAKGQLTQVEKTIQEKAEYATAATERYVGGHPWTSLAVAGSIGVVIGLLLTRR